MGALTTLIYLSLLKTLFFMMVDMADFTASSGKLKP